jgi:hypothetical protein
VKREPRAERLRKGRALLLRLPGHLYRGKPSRYIGEHVFVCQVSARFRKGHNLASQRFKLGDAKLPSKGFSGNLAPVSS